MTVTIQAAVPLRTRLTPANGSELAQLSSDQQRELAKTIRDDFSLPLPIEALDDLMSSDIRDVRNGLHAVRRLETNLERKQRSALALHQRAVDRRLRGMGLVTTDPQPRRRVRKPGSASRRGRVHIQVIPKPNGGNGKGMKGKRR